MMTPMYRAMQYFVVGTLHFYRADISASVRADMEADPSGKTEWFVSHHRDLVERISQEAMNLFEYELSHNQMCNGVFCYFAKAQEVATSKAAEP